MFCAGPVSSAGPKMILDTKLPRVRQVKSSKWHMVHRNVLSSSRLKGRRRCGKRSVTCYHFFKHSRGFLWFMICNWLLTANNAHSEAQLLINVQNQVRIALEFTHFPWISICTLNCNVCECQNGLLSVANRARYSNINFEFEIKREWERESACEHLLLCISCDVDLYLLLFFCRFFLIVVNCLKLMQLVSLNLILSHFCKSRWEFPFLTLALSINLVFFCSSSSLSIHVACMES